MDKIGKIFSEWLGAPQPQLKPQIEHHGLDYEFPVLGTRARQQEAGALLATARPTARSGPAPQLTSPATTASVPSYRPAIAASRPAPAGFTTASVQSAPGLPRPASLSASSHSGADRTKAFFNAVETGNVALVRDAISNGIDPNALHSPSGHIALQVALYNKRFAVVDALLPGANRSSKLAAVDVMLELHRARRPAYRKTIDNIFLSLEKGSALEGLPTENERLEHKVAKNVLR